MPARGLVSESITVFSGKVSRRVSYLREPAFGAGAVSVIEVDAVETASPFPEQLRFLVQMLVIFIEVWMRALQAVPGVQVTASEFFDDFPIDLEMGDGFIHKEDFASALFTSRHVYHPDCTLISAFF